MTLELRRTPPSVYWKLLRGAAVMMDYSDARQSRWSREKLLDYIHEVATADAENAEVVRLQADMWFDAAMNLDLSPEEDEEYAEGAIIALQHYRPSLMPILTDFPELGGTHTPEQDVFLLVPQNRVFPLLRDRLPDEALRRGAVFFRERCYAVSW